MENEVKHTPLPYKVGRIKGENLTTIWRNDPDQSEDTNTGWALIGRDIKQEDAAFIVRACNEFYTNKEIIVELLESLEGVISVSNRKTNEYDRAHAAIAKAKGVK